MFLLSLLHLVVAVFAEVHEIEVKFRDNFGESVSKLIVSNIKSSKAEAAFELHGTVNYPVTIQMPSSIHWDQIRYVYFIKDTKIIKIQITNVKNRTTFRGRNIYH